jgi:hypothetical protein
LIFQIHHQYCLLFLMDFYCLKLFLEYIILPLFKFLHRLFSVIFTYLSCHLIENFFIKSIKFAEKVLINFSLLLIFYLFLLTFYWTKYSLF